MKTLIFIIFLTISSIVVKAEIIETYFKYIDTNNTRHILGNVYGLICFNKLENYAFFTESDKIGPTANHFNNIYRSPDYGKNWIKYLSYNRLDDFDLLTPNCVTAPNPNNFFIGYGSKKGIISNIKNNVVDKIDLKIDLEVVEMKMFDENLGVALLRNNFVFEQKLLITKDGWKSWEEIEGIYDKSKGIYAAQSLNFKNKDTLVFSMFYDVRPNFVFLDLNTLDKTNYLITDEMFEDFKYLTYINDIDIVNDSLIFCAGLLKNGDGNRGYDNIFKSIDGGKTWKKIFSKINETPTGPSLGLQRISFFNEKNGIAVGASNSILFTNDGGKTWEYQERLPNMTNSSELYIEWSNRTPIFATDIGGLYRYEGDFFDFSGLQNRFKVSGKVLTEESEPVPNVPILMNVYIPFSTELDTIFTDQNGYYESPELPELEFSILLPRNLFYKKYDFFYHQFYLDKDTTINFTEIVPKNIYKISGRTFENDEPMPGMHVLVRNVNFGDTIIQSDDDGFFEIYAAEGDVVLKSPYFPNFGHIFYDNLYRTFSYFNLKHDTTGVEIEINSKNTKLYRVSGKVTFNEKNIENAKIKTELISDIPNVSYSTINGNYYTAFFDSFFEKVTIKLDSVIDGVTYTVTPKEYVIKRNDFNDSLFDFDFVLSPMSSVEKDNNTSKIFPNPTSESITISGFGLGKLELYNTLGQKLIEKEITGTTQLNTSTLQTGLYIIKLESGGEVVFEKVIIAR